MRTGLPPSLRYVADSVVRPNADPGQIAIATTRQAVSDSGSGLGAATCGRCGQMP